MNLKRSAAAVVFLLIIVFSFSSASAQLAKVNVGYSAISGDQLPLWVGKELGIFDKNGLDVQPIFFTGGSTAILALVSGDVPITQVSGPGLVSSALGGSDAVFVAGGMTSLNYVLMGKPGITTAEQLKGGSVEISRFGAVHRMYTDKEGTIKVLAKYMGGNVEREILEKSRDNVLTEALLPKKQYPTMEGLKFVIEDLAERDPRAKTVKPEQFLDLTFIKELDQSGFIDGLYKKK